MKILVVEDERHLARLLQVNLQRAGFDVSVAYCAEDALLVAEREQPGLAIIDQTLPDTAGDILARMLHTRQSPPALLLLFPKGIQEDWVQGWIAIANAYLTKPFNPQEVTALTRRILSAQPMPVTQTEDSNSEPSI